MSNKKYELSSWNGLKGPVMAPRLITWDISGPAELADCMSKTSLAPVTLVYMSETLSMCGIPGI